MKRSYQAFYRSGYDGYIAKAIEDHDLQIKAGNPKVPTYSIAATVRNSFKITGLVPKQSFDLDILHPPLRALFDANFPKDSWDKRYAELLFSDYGNE